MKLRNWKTTISGISVILGGVSLLLAGSMGEGITAILGGIGLISARDHDNHGILK